ncbi:MAG: hypothetical protein ABSG36_19785 [Acidimicrobiales bacterium]
MTHAFADRDADLDVAVGVDLEDVSLFRVPGMRVVDLLKGHGRFNGAEKLGSGP